MSELELLKDFLTKVKAMREAQRAYFKTGSSNALGQAKNAEYEVDKTISMLDDTGQGQLFGEEEPARALGMPLSTAPQPMDTAPTDGRKILVDASQGGWIEAYWDVEYNEWDTDHHADWFTSLGPKRWMPKPQDEEVQS